MYTKEAIRNLLATNDKAVWRGLVCLYERQTSDEKEAESTNHLNKKGFNARDAKFGSRLAVRIMKWQPNKWYAPLTPEETIAAREMLYKYAGQLAKVANEKATA